MTKYLLLLPLLLLSPLAFAALNGISIQGLVYLVIYICIIGLIFWVIWWFIGYVGIPEPFNKIIRVIVALVALLIVIALLLEILGPMPSLR